jgi:hypothetical protein
MRSVSHDAGDVALSLHRVRADLPVIFTNGSSRAIQQLNEIFYPNTEEPMNTIQGLRWLTDNFFFAPGMRRMSKDQCLTLYRMVADRAGAHKLIQPTEWTLVEEALDGIYRTKLTSTQTACSEIRLAARMPRLAARMPSGLPPRLIERSFHTVIEPNRKRSKFQKVTYYCMFSLSRPWSHAMAKEGVLEQCWADLTGHEVFSDVRTVASSWNRKSSPRPSARSPQNRKHSWSLLSLRMTRAKPFAALSVRQRLPGRAPTTSSSASLYSRP